MTLRGIDAERLITCHPDLQKLVTELAKAYEVRVICGHRNKLEQDTAFTQRKSKLKWPKSRHNSVPSQAVDMIPMRNGVINWQDIDGIKKFAEDVFATAKTLGIEITWGGDWAMRDYVHWELKHVST